MKRTKHLLTALVFAGAIVLIVTGILSGEVKVVLQKAISICLECIGIG